MKSLLVACALAGTLITGFAGTASAQMEPGMHRRMMHHDRMMMHHRRMMMHRHMRYERHMMHRMMRHDRRMMHRMHHDGM